MASGALRDEANSWFVGEAFQVFYDYKKIGIWQLDEADEAAKNGQKPGDIKIQDTDGNGEITPEDRVIYSKRPKVTFGINNSFTIHDFEFSFFIYSRLGQWIDYEFNRGYKPDGLENSSNVDYWTPENQGAKHWAPGSQANSEIRKAANYKDCSFVKVGNITLGYEFNPKMLRNLKLERLRVYLTALNPFVFTEYDGWDPEWAERSVNSSALANTTIMGGINLSF